MRIGLRVDMVVSYKGKSLEPKSMAPRPGEPFVGASGLEEESWIGRKNIETKKFLLLYNSTKKGKAVLSVFTAQIQNLVWENLRVVNLWIGRGFLFLGHEKKG